jgi:hypothetical protein
MRTLSRHKRKCDAKEATSVKRKRGVNQKGTEAKMVRKRVNWRLLKKRSKLWDWGFIAPSCSSEVYTGSVFWFWFWSADQLFQHHFK